MAKNEAPASIRDKVNDNKHSCSDHILQTLKQINFALTYKDFGTTYRYGTLRNTASELVNNGKILKLPKEYPTRFILPQWAHRPEYSSVQRNDTKGTVGRFDFLSYLESLAWTSPLSVHNLKLGFSVYQLHWQDASWEYCRESKSYSRGFGLSYPVKVQCFETGSVLVNVRCSSRPFPLDFTGLLALSNLLGEVRNALRASCIPDPMIWRVEQWHLNRDSEELMGGGLDVNLTFRDFFGDSAQFYCKRSLDKMRAEVNQSPKQTLQELFETILDRDNADKVGV